MRGKAFAVAAVLACQVLTTSTAKAEAADFEGASWIWFPGDNAKQPPAATRYFRSEFHVPDGTKVKSAEMVLSADNLYTVWLNGKSVGASESGGSAWKQPKRFDVAGLVTAGRNVVAVEAVNTVPGPAGLLVKLVVRPERGAPIVLSSDGHWKSADDAFEDWESPGYQDVSWQPARVVGEYGCRPWHTLDPAKAVPPEVRLALADPRIAGGVVFLRGNVAKPHHFPLHTEGPKQERKSFVLRAYPENDVPAPAVLGRQMFALLPARPDTQPRLLIDAETGTLGSPSVSYDGQTIYFAMAPAGEAFYHLYRLPAAGGAPVQLTHGTFHDYDPEPLPDGRIAFSSTRIGSREEYHGNLASSIFVMDADGSAIVPLTNHIVADREPRVTAFGSLVVVRADNFLERAKVETQLHHLRMDGTGGTVILGNDRGPIGYQRATGNEGPLSPPLLRFNGFGSPSPLPDGRVAALSRDGLVLSGLDPGQGRKVPTAVPLFDIAPLPDGRLLATTLDKKSLAAVDLRTGAVAPFLSSRTGDMHSVVYLGPRPKPASMASVIEPGKSRENIGYLYCQNARYTKQTTADPARIKAVRIYEGVPLAIRPDHYPYQHIGVEARELGTVPLAADGSFYVRVPADRALAMQAVDGEGRAVINELSWIYVRPGEQRSCVGCHSPRAGSPPTVATGRADRAAPVDLLGEGATHRFRGNNAELGGILNLQLDRMRETASVNLYAQPPLEAAAADDPLPPGRPALVDSLCRQLASSEPPQKVAALQRLALLHDRAATSSLVKTLADADSRVRMNAALALSACGTREAVAPLLSALGDRQAVVAQAANLALENLTGHTVRLDPHAADDREEPTAAWQAPLTESWRTWLAEHTGEKLTGELIGQLAADDPTAVAAAVDALGHVGTATASDALQGLLHKHLDEKWEGSDIRTALAVMRALGQLQARNAVLLLESVLNLDCKAGAGPVRRRNVHLAAGAAEALGRIGSPEAERALLAICPKLESFEHYSQVCGDHPVLRESHSSILHFRILEALDAIGTHCPQVLGSLVRSVPGDLDRGLLVENDAYETLVARVAQRSGLTPELLETCLGVLGDEQARAASNLLADLTSYPMPILSERMSKPLEEFFKSPRGGLTFLPYTPAMRSAQMISVLVLDPRLTPRIVAALDRYRKQAHDPADFRSARDRAWVCFYLARALGKVGDPQAIPTLIACLEDDPTEAALGRTTPPHPMSFQAITPFYRAAAAYAVGAGGDRRAIPVLLRVVADFDNALDVRHSAARGILRAAQPADLPALTRLADDYPEVAIRRILLDACRKLGAAGPT